MGQNANPYIKEGSLIVTKDADTIAQEHYELNTRLGMIKFLETSGLKDGDTVTLAYSTADWDAWVIPANTQSSIRGELILDGRNRVNGADIKLHAPRVSLATNGAFNFFSDEFNTLNLSGRAEVAEGYTAPFTVTVKG